MSFDVWILLLIPIVAFGAALLMIAKARLTEAEARLMEAQRRQDYD